MDHTPENLEHFSAQQQELEEPIVLTLDLGEVKTVNAVALFPIVGSVAWVLIAVVLFAVLGTCHWMVNFR